MWSRLLARTAVPRNAYRSHIIALYPHMVKPAPTFSQTQSRALSDVTLPQTSDLFSVDLLRSLGLPETHKNDIPLLKLFDMHREAGKYMNTMERFEQAADILVGALDWAKSHKISGTWILGCIHLDLAFCFQQLQNYELALSEYERGFEALPLSECNKPHIDKRCVGTRYLSFAELLSCMGRQKEAEEACRSAILILENGLGPKDDIVGLALNNLASYLSMQGNYDAAVSTNERALSVLEHSLGRDNSVTRSCAVNLANLYHTLNKAENVASLDLKFKQPEVSATPRHKADYPTEFLSKLRKKWETQGSRDIFDPPGLHRSSKLATQTYSAFFAEWHKGGQKIEPCYYDIIEDETRSISYAIDRIKPWQPPQLRAPSGELVYSSGITTNIFGMKLPDPVTSVYEIIENRKKDDPTKWDPDSYELTAEELAGVQERRAEIKRLRKLSNSEEKKVEVYTEKKEEQNGEMLSATGVDEEGEETENEDEGDEDENEEEEEMSEEEDVQEKEDGEDEEDQNEEEGQGDLEEDAEDDEEDEEVRGVLHYKQELQELDLFNPDGSRKQ